MSRPCYLLYLLAFLAPFAAAQEKNSADKPTEKTASTQSLEGSESPAVAGTKVQEPTKDAKSAETPEVNPPKKQPPAEAKEPLKPDGKKAKESMPTKDASQEKPAAKADAVQTNGQKGKPQTNEQSAKDNVLEMPEKTISVPSKPKKPAKPERKKLPSIGYTDTPMIPGQPWRVHDLVRPRPQVVKPGELSPADPPSDALVLFDGTDLSAWGHTDREVQDGFIEAGWKVENGYMEVTRGFGSLYSLDSVGSCQLHIEWASPAEVKGNGQGRGNSGIKFLGKYEVQVLDSYENRTYADGQAGSIYGQYPPMVNAARPPGEWQAYDIIFEIAEFDAEGKLVKPAYITVMHNGVLIHHRRELSGPTGRSNSKFSQHPPAGTIMLQDHGNPTRYRNIWVRPL